MAAPLKANAIKLFGAKEMELAFSRLERNTQRAIFRRVMRDMLKRIVVTAKALVPVLTGALKRAIKVRALTRSRTKFGVNIVISSKYAMAVETGRRGKDDLAGHAGVMAAQPYLRPAWDMHRPQMEAEIEAGFDEGLRDSWEKNRETPDPGMGVAG